MQGGSVTPQVSPDGKSLAYIRRVRLQSHLFLRDLERARPFVVQQRRQDLQEAWAIHGLYSQFAWTPDGKSILIWGEGKIWNVDVTSGKGQQVPFVAQVEQTLNDAVRFPQKVHPTSSRSRCCVTCVCRRMGSWLSTARSDISTFGRCQPASRAA